MTRSSLSGLPSPNPFAEALAMGAAKDAGLRYSSDARPGLRRQRQRKNFSFLSADGKRVSDTETLARITRLAIPPAWEDVWICPFANGHLQATGRDARGRKQYRYHEQWRRQRDETKFSRIMAFAKVLPKIRRQVARDLKLLGMPRKKALATVVRLLETTLIRVGNDEYARNNNSYGLTTMRNKHVKIQGRKISFSFTGKSGKKHEIDVRDRHLARIVQHCQDLPGQELFGYEGEDGTHRDVASQDVNDYLREICGQEFPAKDFRTWAGTVLAAIALREFEKVASEREAKSNIVAAVEAVARALGNTPAVCRKCYVHPAIFDTYLQNGALEILSQRAEQLDHSSTMFKSAETAVLTLLRRQMGKKTTKGK